MTVASTHHAHFVPVKASPYSGPDCGKGDLRDRVTAPGFLPGLMLGDSVQALTLRTLWPSHVLPEQGLCSAFVLHA